jgi:hypothetical protein
MLDWSINSAAPAHQPPAPNPPPPRPADRQNRLWELGLTFGHQSPGGERSRLCPTQVPQKLPPGLRPSLRQTTIRLKMSL